MAAEKSDRIAKSASDLYELLKDAAPFVADNNYGTDASAASLTKRITKVLSLIDGTFKSAGAENAKKAQDAFAVANGLTKPDPKPLANRKPIPDPKKRTTKKSTKK